MDNEHEKLACAAHNFLVTVRPWMHHKTSFLSATIADLKYELSKVLDDYKPDGIYARCDETGREITDDK